VNFRNWKVKAILQKTLSYIPFGIELNNFLQKNVTKGLVFSDALFNQKFIHFKDHLKFLNEFGNDNYDNVFELGTGWHPIVPIGMYLIGIENIITVDLNHHLTKENLIKTAQHYLAEGFDTNGITFKAKRVEKLQQVIVNAEQLELTNILRLLNINYVVGDFISNNTFNHKISFVCSNNTLEHIYPDLLAGIFERIDSYSKANCIHSHFVDMTDHFAHFDKRINVYNYLKFTDEKWSWIDNSIQPQNRLREIDYKNFFEKRDYKLLDHFNRPGKTEDLKFISKKFEENYSKEELAVTHTHLVYESKS